jgi:hypothetical protein
MSKTGLKIGFGAGAAIFAAGPGKREERKEFDSSTSDGDLALNYKEVESYRPAAAKEGVSEVRSRCGSPGRRYIERILEELKDEPYIKLDAQGDTQIHKGAFLSAALAIIKDVPSPTKERALVSLVMIKKRVSGDSEDVAHEQWQRLGNLLGRERRRRWG